MYVEEIKSFVLERSVCGVFNYKVKKCCWGILKFGSQQENTKTGLGSVYS